MECRQREGHIVCVISNRESLEQRQHHRQWQTGVEPLVKIKCRKHFSPSEPLTNPRLLYEYRTGSAASLKTQTSLTINDIVSICEQ